MDFVLICNLTPSNLGMIDDTWKYGRKISGEWKTKRKAFDIIRCAKTTQPWLGDDGYNNQLDYFLGSKHRK
ncbi:hypothetical protein TSUD_45870 [Trifolium subterraneum]|nr:hypothetical protein TSUD_45870 [Trifolium subterraneum]